MMNQTRTLTQTNATFMSKVYLWMVVGLGISGGIAYTVGNSQELVTYLLSHRWVTWCMFIAQIGSVLFLSRMINRINVTIATALYLTFSALTGLTFWSIFVLYTMSSISQAFFITSFAFAGLSMFGFVTKRDLGPIGSFCMTGLFGLIGLIIATYLFPSLMSNALSMTISFVGILIFSGLTAYDTQRIKNFNITMSDSPDMAKKAVIMGAMTLYLDFINLFLMILRLFGNRR